MIAMKSKSQDFRLGFKANPLFSNLKPSSDNHDNVSTRLGFSYGLIFDYFLKENYAIETEFGISSMGGKVQYSKGDTTITSSVKMNYVEVPISIKLLTAEIKPNLKVYGKFGVNLGFSTKTSAEVVYKKGTTEFANDDIKNANKYIQPFNVSLLMGAGVEYNIAKNLDLMLGFSYANGFFNTMKTSSLYRSSTIASSTNIKPFDADLNYLCVNIGLLF
jgi:opacity protein-like surface antigen